MQFDKKELKVGADCTEVELTLKHSGTLAAATMGHNWVLTKTADLQAVATDGMAATLKNNYLKAGDKRVIAHTKVIGGGESTKVKFATSALTKGGDYSFFCSFPGHSGLMKGKLVF
jgi:azurin